MSNISRNASRIVTVAAGLAGLVGCTSTPANTSQNTPSERRAEVPSVDVVPFANNISVGATAGNQTLSGNVAISQKQPIPFTDDRATGALVSVDAAASAGDYNRAEKQDVHATELGGKIELGLYHAMNGGKFISLSPFVSAERATTNGSTENRIVLSYGADLLGQIPLGSDYTFLRASLGGSAQGERSSYEQDFDGKGTGYELHAQVLQDLWANVNTDAAGKATLDKKISLALGGSFSQMNRDITGNINGHDLKISESERRAGGNVGVLYFDNTRGFYVLPGARVLTMDLSRDGNTSSHHNSGTIASAFVEAGYNLRRLADSDPSDDTWALFLKAQVGYEHNNRGKGSAYVAFNISLNDAMSIIGRAFNLKTN